jgi:hypothetical protein
VPEKREISFTHLSNTCSGNKIAQSAHRGQACFNSQQRLGCSVQQVFGEMGTFSRDKAPEAKS